MSYKKDGLTVFGLLAGFILVAEISAQGALYDREGQIISDDQVQSPDVAWTIMTSNTGGPYFGVGKLLHTFVPTSGCTATLIDTGNFDAPAIVLTAGHCARNILREGLIPAGQYLEDESSEGALIYFKRFAGDAGSSVLVPVSRILFATMSTFDIAFLEIESSLGALVAQGIIPRKIKAQSQGVASRGIKLEQLGYPNGRGSNNLGMVKAECEGLGTVQKDINLSGSKYSWPLTLVHRCSAIEGISGSPLFDKSTGEIVAVTNMAGRELNGAQQIAPFAACFDHGVYSPNPDNGCTIPALKNKQTRLILVDDDKYENTPEPTLDPRPHGTPTPLPTSQHQP